jgi:hypothetical protein
VVARAAQLKIARLDRSLAKSGQTVILQRIIGTVNQARSVVTLKAHVRSYDGVQLQGGIVQGDRRVIISPTEIIANNWPGGLSGNRVDDPRVPRRGDSIIIAGRECAVLNGAPIYLDGTSDLVRIDIQVRG